MDPGSTPPAPSAHKYMTVPEKIELTSGGIRGGYSSSEPWMNQSTSGYRPMNVRRVLKAYQYKKVTLITYEMSSRFN